MDASRPIKKSSRTASRVIDGRAVVIVIDKNELHTLNAVATRVWELADGRPLSAIAEDIHRSFAVDCVTATQDVERFVSELIAIGALDGASTA